MSLYQPMADTEESAQADVMPENQDHFTRPLQKCEPQDKGVCLWCLKAKCILTSKYTLCLSLGCKSL